MANNVTPIPGQHGGARPGAGRKPKSQMADPNDPHRTLTIAKARREMYKAGLAEIELQQARGELVQAEDVRQTWAASLKRIALAMETLTDVIERDAGLSPEQAQVFEGAIDRVRAQLYASLTGEEEEDD